MTEEELTRLREEVFRRSTMRESYWQGERHWRAVAHAGLQIAPQVPGCRPLVVFLFALFHDARRENEFSDPQHGPRGADLARELGVGDELLFVACRDHTYAPPTDDPTLGACWDSDRINLWRVGITPDSQFLSTAPAREPVLIQAAQAFHDAEYDWDELARSYLDLDRRS